MPMLLNLGYVHKLELFSIHDSRSDQCKHISTLTISVKKGWFWLAFYLISLKVAPRLLWLHFVINYKTHFLNFTIQQTFLCLKMNKLKNLLQCISLRVVSLFCIMLHVLSRHLILKGRYIRETR